MQTFSLTDTGRMRTVNQDYVFCQDTEIGSFPNLFIVADGMGGHNAGDTASRMCVEEVVSQIQKSTKITPIGIFEQAVAAANEKVYQASKEDPSLYGMGTTVVAAMVLGKTVYVVNVGDSRLYVCKESLTQVTVDHSLVEEMVQSGKLQKKRCVRIQIRILSHGLLEPIRRSRQTALKSKWKKGTCFCCAPTDYRI